MKRIDLTWIAILTFPIMLGAGCDAAYGQVELKVSHDVSDHVRSAYSARDFAAVIRLGRKALKESAFQKDIEHLVQINNLMASSYTKLRNFESALDHLSKARNIGEQNLTAGHPLLGDTFFFLGVYYDLVGMKDESLASHEKALEIRLNNYGENHSKVAESYNGLGELFIFNFSDYSKAISYYLRSLKIIEADGLSDPYLMYAGYCNLAQAYRMREDVDNALVYAFKALGVVNNRKEFISLVGKCHILLGDIYYGQTEYRSALDYWQQGIDYSVRTEGEDNYNLIQTYTSLGMAFGEMDEPDRAIRSFRKSLAIYSRHPHPNNNLQAENFLHLGRMFQKVKMLDSAETYFKKCLQLQIHNFGEKNLRTSMAYSYLAKLFKEAGKLDSASFYIQKALIAGVDSFSNPDIRINPDLSKETDPFDMFEVFSDKGSILTEAYVQNPRDPGTLSSAFECFKISDALMELNRSAYHQEGAKLFFADHYHHIYENALHAAWLLFHKTNDPGYFSDAIGFMEKSKAILLAESLNKAEIFTRAGLPDSVRELERNLNTALATYRSQIETATVDVQQRLHARIFEISQKQQRLLDTIADRYPSYFQIRYQKISTLPEIQEFSQKTNAAIIEFFWGEDKIFVLGISGKKIIFREINEVDSINQHVRRYFESLQHIPAWKDKNVPFEKFFKNSRSIYTELLAPVLDEMETEKLIIIRDGPLLMIPFESLVVSDKNSGGHDFQRLDYLLKHYTVSYAHSADLLLKNARQDLSAANSKVLAFSFSPLLVTANLSSSRGMNELPGAAREISAIAEVFPGTFLLGEDATEQKFKTLAPDFDILHLAVHGKSDPGKQFSGSLFFKNAQDDEEDGELHVYELYDLALKARLAVLSACESGAGKIFRGEGVFSIARGFAYAGCPSTVMTLWPVSDVASAQIMADFYSALSKGEDIDHSLRQAKLRYLRNADSYLAHPAYWAAYIPTGNMRAIVPPPAAPRLISAVVGLAILLLTGYWLAKRKRRRIALDHMLNSRAS